MKSTYQDRQRRTCIVIDSDNEDYVLVKLDTCLGLRIYTMPVSQFEDTYSEIKDYPIHKSIEQYAEFARFCGAAQDVIDSFNSILDAEENKGIDVSLTRLKLQQVKLLDADKPAQKQSDKQDSDTPPWDDTPSTELSSKPTTKGSTTMAKQSTKAATKVPSGQAANTASIKQPRRSAASMFKDLILTGQFTDDEIFAAVQKEFGLDDSKRHYVAYYRRELKNKGLI